MPHCGCRRHGAWGYRSASNTRRVSMSMIRCGWMRCRICLFLLAIFELGRGGQARLLRFGYGHAFELVALLGGVDHVLALGDLSEDGVLAVQPVGGDVGDEELAAVGARPGVDHRERAHFVLVWVALELVVEA